MRIAHIGNDQADRFRVAETKSLSMGIWLVSEFLDGTFDPLVSFFRDRNPAIRLPIQHI
jgi:hypothetical protein